MPSNSATYEQQKNQVWAMFNRSEQTIGYRMAVAGSVTHAVEIAKKLNHHDQMLSLLHRLLNLFPNPTADSVAGELVGDVRELLKEIDQ